MNGVCMKVKRIEEFLPEFFRKFLPDFFKNSIPEETAANCGDCPMLQKPGNGGLKEDYYKETFHLVADLTPDDFEKITGISHIVLLEKLKVKHKNLILSEPPKTLKRNPNLRVKRTEDNTYILIGYSPRDPVEVPARVYEILDFFDGQRSTDEACQLIYEHKNIEPARDLLISLYQLRILLKCE